VAAAGQLIERIRGRLLRDPQSAEEMATLEPDWIPPGGFSGPARQAAVLIGSVLYTERSPDLRSHSGQIAFPGGKIDPGDDGPADAALREAWEEVALERRDAEVLGYLPAYFTGSNYLITPVVAVVKPSAPFIPNPGEVKSAFEVPLGRLMQEEGFSIYRISHAGEEHSTWQVLHEGLVIWGITANLTRRFYEIALKDGV
jgi:8-oxo-dGTP pyrophosphatase MutT (NUDIX family)